MKKYLFAFSILQLTCFTMQAQNCKPNLDKTDKITKQGNIGWESIIYESNFGNALINTSDWYLAVQFARYGNENDILLFLNKYEESAQNQTFESQYKGEKGSSYYFAFSQGEPIKLIVGDTKTVSKMDNFSGKLITTVTIGSILSDTLIKQFRDKLNSSTLTTVRIMMAGNMNFERDIKPTKAAGLKEKFNCFYDWNNSNPLKPGIAAGGDVSLTGFPPLDEITGKVSYSEVVNVDAGTSVAKLYERAKKWMINYFNDNQFKLDLPEEGKLSRSAMHTQTFTFSNGKQSVDDMSYNISISVKDGKYKYTITDIVDNDGKTKQTAEMARDVLKGIPVTVATPLVEQYNSGFNKLIASLKNAMIRDVEKKDDW